MDRPTSVGARPGLAELQVWPLRLPTGHECAGLLCEELAPPVWVKMTAALYFFQLTGLQKGVQRLDFLAEHVPHVPPTLLLPRTWVSNRWLLWALSQIRSKEVCPMTDKLPTRLLLACCWTSQLLTMDPYLCGIYLAGNQVSMNRMCAEQCLRGPHKQRTSEVCTCT